jgi:hypothetical protein
MRGALSGASPGERTCSTGFTHTVCTVLTGLLLKLTSLASSARSANTICLRGTLRSDVLLLFADNAALQHVVVAGIALRLDVLALLAHSVCGTRR